MLMLDLILAALVGSLYGALGSKGEKIGCAALAWLGYAGMFFASTASFVFIISANLGAK
jgi:hypothetical protein